MKEICCHFSLLSKYLLSLISFQKATAGLYTHLTCLTRVSIGLDLSKTDIQPLTTIYHQPAKLCTISICSFRGPYFSKIFRPRFQVFPPKNVSICIETFFCCLTCRHTEEDFLFFFFFFLFPPPFGLNKSIKLNKSKS